MADIVDARTRSRMMAAVRRENTAPELALRRALHALGVRGYRLHRRDIPGSPDIVWIGRRVAVFVDGSFWHGHPSAYKPGKSGEFWDKKIARNIERDRAVDAELTARGWIVLRFWDFEVKADALRCAERVKQVLESLTSTETGGVGVYATPRREGPTGIRSFVPPARVAERPVQPGRLNRPT